MKNIGKPCAGEPHARFDEGGQAKACSLLYLAVSAMFVLLMSGLILYETSNIIHGGETNYIMATVTLFVSIFNLFTSLLHLLGFTNGND
jgi:modulator of FtsH protease